MAEEEKKDPQIEDPKPAGKPEIVIEPHSGDEGKPESKEKRPSGDEGKPKDEAKEDPKHDDDGGTSEVESLKQQLARLEHESEIRKASETYGISAEVLEKTGLSGDSLADFAKTLKEEEKKSSDDTSEAVKAAVRRVSAVSTPDDPWMALANSMSKRIFG